MRFLILLALSILYLYLPAEATKFGKLHKCQGIAGDDIVFDSENNAWFGCETGLYKVPYGTDSLIKVKEFRDDSQVVKIDYNRVFHEGSPSVIFAGESMILEILNKFYLIKDKKITRLDTLREDIQNSTIKTCHSLDNKTFWLNIIQGQLSFMGLYHLDPETMTWEHFPWIKDGRGYPEVGFDMFHLTEHNGYYWYPGTESELTFFNQDTAGRINLEALMDDSVAFGYKVQGRFHNGCYYFNGFDNKLYIYNFDTGVLSFEDLINTIAYKENEEMLNFNELSHLGIAMVTDKFQIIKVVSDAEGFKHWYYKKTGDSLYHKIEADTTLITGFSRAFVDNDGIIWTSVGYDNVETDRHELGIIKFDPLAPGTSVEEAESMPTLQTTRLYPNPTKRTATVRFFLNPNFRKEVKFDIYDYMGNKVKSLDSEYSYDASIAFGTKTIDVVGMHTGAYYLVIDNGNEKSSIGFIVE